MNYDENTPDWPRRKVAPDYHTFIAIGPNVWGRGGTIRSAVRNAQVSSSRFPKGTVWSVRMVPYDDNLNVSPVTGGVTFTTHDCGIEQCSGNQAHEK